MAPEQPPFLVVLDTRLDGARLVGTAWYYDPASGKEHVRVRWGFGDAPPDYESVCDGVVFVADHQTRPKDDHAQVLRERGGGYRYSEGLGGVDQCMLVMALPPGLTLDGPDLPPHGARTFGDRRLAVYWLLRRDPDGRAVIGWKLRPTGTDLEAELQALSAGRDLPLDEEWATREHDIFLSYRHDDSGWQARFIDERLVARFGRKKVFRDTPSTPAGGDFRVTLDEAVGRCRVMVVVVGPRWAGDARLQNSDDYVRIEIESALQRDIPVVPLFIDGTKLDPLPLPASLRDLAYRQGMPVRRDTFDGDMERLIKGLEDRLAPRSA